MYRKVSLQQLHRMGKWSSRILFEWTKTSCGRSCR